MSSSTTPTHHHFDELDVEIHPDAASMGRAAAEAAAETLRSSLESRDRARIILASANSQLPFFEALREVPDVDWSRVEAFHMDEYVGIDADHPASFRCFLQREVVEPLGLAAFHGISSDPDKVDDTCRRYAGLLNQGPIDLCCMGIGENGHLAFNDPPFARFDDPEPVRLVELDQVSRQQQVGEGHFPDLNAVPTHAISLTIPTLLRAKRVLVIVPEARKAVAIRAALTGPIDPSCPASILRKARHAVLYLDRDAASKLPLT